MLKTLASRASALDARVRRRVEQVLQATCDLVVWQRINGGGGSTDWYLLCSIQDFDRMLETAAAPPTCS
jgi:hypothetical protein